MNKITECALGMQKFLGAAAGVVAILVAQGLLTGATAHWTTVVIAALGAALVYFLPNKDANGNNKDVSQQALNDAVAREKARAAANSLPTPGDVDTSVPIADDVSTDRAAEPVVLPTTDQPADPTNV